MNATSRLANERKFAVLGIPESARVIAFCQAAKDAGISNPDVHSWADVLPTCALPGSPASIRLESPGRNWTTERMLLQAGASIEDEADPSGLLYERVEAEAVEPMGEPAGRVIAMRQWYLGWRAALQSLATYHEGTRFFNTPGAIAVLFDKEVCQQHLETSGCPMPPSLGVPANFDDLIERMRKQRRARVFLKACHGSSASGVLALETSRGRIQAYSTAKLVEKDGRKTLWNTRPGKLYRDLREIKLVVDAICRQRAQAQVWIPKIGWNECRVDLRIVTIAGRATHAVLRASKSPFTNLQLRNRRGDLEQFARAHRASYDLALAAAERAAACFPDCFTLGVDVAISTAGKAYVLEANAFGDHLPGCMADGRDTYRAQIEQWLKSPPAARNHRDYQTPLSMPPLRDTSSSSAALG